jgi:hypothetical protein
MSLQFFIYRYKGLSLNVDQFECGLHDRLTNPMRADKDLDGNNPHMD